MQNEACYNIPKVTRIQNRSFQRQLSGVHSTHLLFELLDDVTMKLVAEVFNRPTLDSQYYGGVVVRQLTFRLCVSVPQINSTLSLYDDGKHVC